MAKLSLYSLALILCIVTSGCLARVHEIKSEDPIVRAFKSLKSEEKNDFLAYFLALGVRDWIADQPRPPKHLMHKGDLLVKQLHLSEDKIQKFEKMNIPKESRKKLLSWTKKEFGLTTRDILDILRMDRSDAGKLPDIGGLCCPW